MVTNTEITKFYEFWAWQYKKRNPRILESAKTIKRNSELLYCAGLLEEKTYPKGLASDDDRHIPSEFKYLRKATKKEQRLINEIERFLPLLACVGFSIDDVITDKPDTLEIMDSIISRDDIYQMTPRWQRKLDADVVQNLGKADGRSWYSFCVDVSAPDEAIIPAMLREIHHQRREIRGCSYSQKVCEDSCPELNTCASTHNKLVDDELSATYGAQYGVAFRSGSPEARATGLWLWDYIEANGGKNNYCISSAVDSIRAQYKQRLDDLGVFASRDRTITGYYEKTAKCIEACKVLPFK